MKIRITKIHFVQILSIILALVVAVAPISKMSAHADGATSGSCGDGVTWFFDSGTLTISKTGAGTGAMTDYVITPATQVYAPWNHLTITNVVIENGVTTIGDNAFWHKTEITSVSIPDSVTSIGDAAFTSTGITSILIPNSVTYIGCGSFDNCQGLTSVVIPDSVITIDYSAFYYCENLSTVTLGNSLKTIGDYAFQNTAITSIEIPASVTYIGDHAIGSKYDDTNGDYYIQTFTLKGYGSGLAAFLQNFVNQPGWTYVNLSEESGNAGNNAGSNNDNNDSNVSEYKPDMFALYIDGLSFNTWEEVTANIPKLTKEMLHSFNSSNDALLHINLVGKEDKTIPAAPIQAMAYSTIDGIHVYVGDSDAVTFINGFDYSMYPSKNYKHEDTISENGRTIDFKDKGKLNSLVGLHTVIAPNTRATIIKSVDGIEIELGTLTSDDSGRICFAIDELATYVIRY